ncbi:pPIWI_RE_Y domain-containing protein [Streptosporangium saharense]|uniref:pPIWI_RE_Y domain-containing protein n=1 Tax=Streptosporangium saharense TaxID=1706840 RepID=UPI00369801B6
MTGTDLPESPGILDHIKGAAYDRGESIRILRMAAAAAEELTDWPSGKPFAVPYPVTTQRVIDRIALIGVMGYSHGLRDCPRSLAELTRWFREKPVSEWPFLSLPSDPDYDEKLIQLDPVQPSDLCVRLALHHRNPGDENLGLERLILKRVHAIYSDAGLEFGHLAFRDAIIEHPVLTRPSYAEFKTTRVGDLYVTDELINTVYVEVDDKYLDARGVAATCSTCDLLLVVEDGRRRCETPRCPGRTRVLVGESHVGRDLKHLSRPVRQLLVAPRRIARHVRESSS